jgi:hypothetical protein
MFLPINLYVVMFFWAIYFASILHILKNDFRARSFVAQQIAGKPLLSPQVGRTSRQRDIVSEHNYVSGSSIVASAGEMLACPRLARSGELPREAPTRWSPTQ